jgi:serine protease Do
MKTWLKILSLPALLCFALGVWWHTAPYRTGAAATVKVVLPGGHGSGVHIGGRLVLTAAHVVEDDQEVTIKTEAGREFKARTLWRSPKLDVALMRYEGALIPAAPLSCVAPKVEDAITMIGNPGPFEFLRFKGHVAGTQRGWAFWRVMVPLDLTAMGGVSGGPVLNTQGAVIGLLVGGIATPFAPISGISVMVPSTVICGLLGR